MIQNWKNTRMLKQFFVSRKMGQSKLSHQPHTLQTQIANGNQ